MFLKHAPDEVSAGGGESNELDAVVFGRGGSGDELELTESVDDAGDARWADDEALAEITESELAGAFFFSAPESAEDAPVGAADAELGEVGFHDAADEAEGADEASPGGFSLAVGGWGGFALHGCAGGIIYLGT